MQSELQEYLRRLRAGENLADFAPQTGLVVDKAKLAAGGEYNLSGERYRENGPQTSAYPMVKIEDVVNTVTPPVKIPKTSFAAVGRFPIIDQSQNEVAGWTDDESALINPKKPLVIFGDHTCAVKLATHPFAQGADGIKILQTHDELEPGYLFYTLRVRPLETDGYKRHFSKLKETVIPLPPLSVQQEILAEIAGYQRVIDGARAVADNWRPRVDIDPSWPVVALGEVCEVIAGQSPPGDSYNAAGTGEPFYQGKTEFGEMFLGDPVKWTTDPKRFAEDGDVLMSVRAPVGPVNLATQRVSIGRGLAAIRPKRDRLIILYGYYVLRSLEARITGSSGATFASINKGEIEKIQIPLPPLGVQEELVAGIEEERRRAVGNIELIAMMQERIDKAIARVWERRE